MNSKRMRFSILVLAVYAVLGVVGAFSQSQTSGDADGIATIAVSSDTARSGSGGDVSVEESLQWHSFLPGAFR